MKKISIVIVCTLCIVCTATMSRGAAGDRVSGTIRGLWEIESSNYNLQHIVNQWMSDLPAGAGQVAIPRSYWVFFMMIYFGDDDILGRIYADDVYNLMVSKIIGYGLDNVEIAPEYKPPQNEDATGTTITCDEDPTGAGRTVLLYAKISGDFVESAITGTLDTGTWTFLNVTGSDIGKYVLAYDDSFASLPTELLTVAP